MTLRYASLAWSLALLVALAPCPTAADPQPGGQVFLGATLDLGDGDRQGRGADINVQIRGESPFAPDAWGADSRDDGAGVRRRERELRLLSR